MYKLTNERRDPVIAAVLFLTAFTIYLRTLAPSVASIFDDTLEIQYVVPRLGILHQTGYPLYTLLGKLFTLVIPLGDPAFRLNLFSAIAAASAVAMLYLVTQRLVSFRMAAVIAALIFAFSPTFWDQSNSAEVYALQMLLSAIILYAALNWNSEPNARKFYVLALAMGLGLTHHRLIVLLYPAITVYVLLRILARRREVSRDVSSNPTSGAWTLNPKMIFRAVILFLSPLLLYLYLPLRGAVGSANGLYENTPQGFFDWVMASQYADFLTRNPLQVQHDATYYWTLFQNQFDILGLALGAIGVVWLARKPREWILLIVALGAQAAFAFNYRTADVQVHFLTSFLLLAIFAGAGADALFNVFSQSAIRYSQFAVGLVSILLFLIPAKLLITNYQANDLSNKWDVHDYGLDLVSQPLESNATIIGILGEMSLVRYFQENFGLRADVQTVPADEEPTRLAAIENALEQNRVVYLTRPLKGAAEKYSLASVGPLILVQPKPATSVPKISNPLDDDFGAMRLRGYDVDASRLSAIPTRWHAENGRAVRVTVYWRADEKISSDAMVSLKILNTPSAFGKEQRVLGQIDRRPVLDAYPTTAWRAGEVVADTYDVPVFLGAPPGACTLSVTMYDADSGAVMGARDLTTLVLAPDFVAPRREVWNIVHTTDADFGAFALAGYSLDADGAARPGDTLPLILLWRASQTKIEDNLRMRVWLEDNEGKSVASRDAAIGSSFPPALWQAGQYVRDFPLIRVPANVADGKYAVKLAVMRGDQLLGSMPLRPTIATLGDIAVKNRARVMTAPASIPRPLEATFDQKIRLLGYAFAVDSSRNARLTLYWKSLALMETSYAVFVHLLDAKDNVVASGDALPGSGEFPTTGWVENEYIADVHSLAIPPDLPRGAYRVEIGWYDPAGGARLQTIDGQNRVLIAPITIP